MPSKKIKNTSFKKETFRIQLIQNLTKNLSLIKDDITLGFDKSDHPHYMFDNIRYDF